MAVTLFLSYKISPMKFVSYYLLNHHKVVLSFLVAGLFMHAAHRSDAQAYFGKYTEVPLSEITPQGWLNELLLRQRNGLGLNRVESGYPYNTCLWAGQIPKGGNPKGQPWWPYEQSGYIVDGLYRCGLLLKDSVLINLGKRNIAFVLEHPRTNGQLCLENLGDTQWPFVVFVRTIMADYAVTKDAKILKALTNHFLALPENLGDREICIIESICWLYQQTNDKRLIELAERIWNNYSSSANRKNKYFQQDKMVAGDSVKGHGVTVSEVGKQPAILYMSTGKEIYKQAAIGFFKSVYRDNMLVDGVPSSSESLSGKKPEGVHETCDISDFSWSLGYLLLATGENEWADKIERGILNAGLGAISKDFKSHEYFSSPNQIFATQESFTQSKHLEWKSRQTYRPGFDTECCSGNVHRIIPIYAGRLWLKDNRSGIVAALYAPNVITTNLGIKQVPVEITETTGYPFSGEIKFSIKTGRTLRFPFSMRIPAWADGATVQINNEKIIAAPKDSFFVLERAFKSGDVITLNLPMEVLLESPSENSVSVTRGPLVFSLLVAENTMAITSQPKTSMNFPAWEITPASPWNYALTPAMTKEVVVQQKPIANFPWQPENSPVILSIPAKRVPSWQADSTTPALPDIGFTTAETERINLIPLGATRIRLSVFPRTD